MNRVVFSLCVWVIYMKRIICCLLTLLPIAGCQWDGSVYDKYADNSGTFTVCSNYCKIDSLDEDSCNKHGRWINAVCVTKDEAGQEVLLEDTTADDCANQGGSWRQAYCDLKIQSEEDCNLVEGVWLELNAQDLGGGRYIVRRLDKNNDPVYRCGSYNFVSNSGNNRETCTDDEINAFEKFREIGLCPVSTPNCVSIDFYKMSDNNDGNTEKVFDGSAALCSACGAGQALCSLDGTSAATGCFDLMTDENNCGACGTQCADGQTCSNGVCTSSCRDSEIMCDNKCFPISTSKYCGVTTCSEYQTLKESDDNSKCNGGEICTNFDGIYKCIQHCSEGQVYCETADHGKGACINPLITDAYCGALAGCVNYVACGEGTSCKGGICTCNNPGEVYCESTTTDGSEGIVKQYACINPKTDDDHCGAAGRCMDESEVNYSGSVCNPDKNQKCVEGRCQCDASQGYLDCGGVCTNIEDLDYCGSTSDLSSNKGKYCSGNSGSALVENTDFTGKCSQFNGLAVDATCGDSTCQCERGGMLFIDRDGGNAPRWQCVDPLSDRKFCANKENPKGVVYSIENGQIKLLDQNTLVECPAGESCDNGVCKVMDETCPEGSVFCNSNARCVDVSVYHFNQDATNCAYGWKMASTTQFDCSKPCTIDIQNDPFHCGAVSKNCYDSNNYSPNYGYYTCSRGTCVLNCAPGYEMCGDKCVKLDYDNTNCGGCGITCNPNAYYAKVCSKSSCALCVWNNEAPKNKDILPCCDGSRYRCKKGSSYRYTCGNKTRDRVIDGYSCTLIKNNNNETFELY